MNSPAMTQDEIARLLPFRVNGSLAEPEAQAVRQMLAQSRKLREEEQALDALRKEMRALEWPISPGELGLARLNRSISAETSQGRPGLRLWPKVGIAAALVALVAAGALILRSPGAPKGGDLYEQAAGEAGAGQLIVGFDRSATQADVEALLLQNDLRIVDGPSALGLYRIQAKNAEGMAEALMALRAARTIVDTAEAAE